jgi:Cu+-exporting ATPase
MMPLERNVGTERANPASADARFTDPVCGMEVRANERGYARTVQGKEYRFCSLGCVEKFEAHPERYSKKHNR